MSYNGWTNYESWCIGLWLSNDQGTYEWAREIVADNLDDDGEVTWLAGDALKGWVQDFQEVDEILSHASFVSDLLSASLGEVDWLEVAGSFAPDKEEATA